MLARILPANGGNLLAGRNLSNVGHDEQLNIDVFLASNILAVTMKVSWHAPPLVSAVPAGPSRVKVSKSRRMEQTLLSHLATVYCRPVVVVKEAGKPLEEIIKKREGCFFQTEPGFFFFKPGF